MGIDHFLDMGRSAINVLGNGIAAAMLAQNEGLLEEEPELVEQEA
jgi:Na+/H+-dicarboxylate symporter